MKKQFNNCVRITVPLDTISNLKNAEMELREFTSYIKKLIRCPYCESDKLFLAQANGRLLSKSLKEAANADDQDVIRKDASYKGAV